MLVARSYSNGAGTCSDDPLPPLATVYAPLSCAGQPDLGGRLGQTHPSRASGPSMRLRPGPSASTLLVRDPFRPWKTPSMGEGERRDLIRRYWESAARGQHITEEIYHDDAVLEFPQSGERFEGRAHLQGVAPGGGRRHRERSASSPMGASAEAPQIGDIRGVRRASCLSREAGPRAASPQSAGAVGTIERTVGGSWPGLGEAVQRGCRKLRRTCGRNLLDPFMAAAFRASTAWQPNSMADQGKRWRGAPQREDAGSCCDDRLKPPATIQDSALAVSPGGAKQMTPVPRRLGAGVSAGPDARFQPWRVCPTGGRC
jgi:hypothetical protein